MDLQIRLGVCSQPVLAHPRNLHFTSPEGEGFQPSPRETLIVTVKKVLSDDVTIILGRPGVPNIEKHLTLGGATLFETPDAGIFELRLMGIGRQLNRVDILVSHVSPHSGMASGFVDQDVSNLPFTQNELQQLRVSMDRIREAMRTRLDLPGETLELIMTKIDYMQGAAERIGRKDWILLAMGGLTGIIAGAQLTREGAQVLIQVANAAFEWLFAGSIKLLP